jgi:adenine-specific DNA-methyltransferase
LLYGGTTVAVVHKMGRRYIGIELSKHAITHCIPRLKKVVDGEQGGGGFCFFRLGEPVFDESNHINPRSAF